MLDSLFFEMYFEPSSKSDTAVCAVRRVDAVMEADVTGAWTHAE